MTEIPTAGLSAPRRKLIEVSLPLEDINKESAREKSIRHGHPSTLHLWWARRPLASARAVLFAQLVDDPSARPEDFPTEEKQRIERERLHDIIRRLVKWENTTDERLLNQAREEIRKSTGGAPPAILDPFAGGGTIPLEAQRLGLEAHASDLNPVAVLINKALIEIPPKFAGRPPVFPGAADERLGEWPRATGLAEDVRRYGAWMRNRAQERIGDLYPTATITDQQTGATHESPVIAWIWARTVTCPNPACGIDMPLVRSWWLGKKKGKEAYVVPTVVHDDAAPSGRRVEFSIGHDPANAPTKESDGTMRGQKGGRCLACSTPFAATYVHSAHDLPHSQKPRPVLLATVASGKRRRNYLEPTDKQSAPSNRLLALAASIRRQRGTLSAASRGTFGGNAQGRRWGFFEFSDYFTDRQLVALTTFSDLVGEARELVMKDALDAGLTHGDPLADGGTGAQAYADAVATYLGFAVSRSANKSTAICSWDSSSKMEAVRGLFARQAIPMTWDFAEANPFGGSSGDFGEDLRWVQLSLERIAAALPTSSALQADAATRNYSNTLISTDPPYYDNIGYSDLSDFFYVWLRRSLRSIHPDLFATMLVPKTEELVANAYRHDGRDGAAKFFEEGFEHVFARARESASDDFPITVYYAFKQQELKNEGVTSTGWATLLEGMIRNGWSITATWPIRTELGNRMLASDTNALASSIVLSLRPRLETASATSRRGFLGALKTELPGALTEMQQGAIAPVDLAQSTIGPGMAIFSRYSRVLENDGAQMSVKTALALINQVLDEILSQNDGDLDSDSRFCLKWYVQFGWDAEAYGEADVLATATNTSIEGLRNAGVLNSGEGKVRLVRPANLPPWWNPATDDRISTWEVACHMARVLSDEDGGIDAAAHILAATRDRGDVDLESVQLLAYRLYELTQSTRPDDARLFNALGGAWAEIVDAARDIQPATVQGSFDLGEEN